MKNVKTTDDLHLRASPNGDIIGLLPKGSVEAVSEQSGDWLHISTGWISATYVEDAVPSFWHMPLPEIYFAKTSQSYLNYDPSLYKQFGYHTGVDYGGRGQTNIPLLACADGEIVYSQIADSPWGKFLGNHAAIYIPAVDKSFLYCHMAAAPYSVGQIKAGDQIGIMGNTGQSAGGAIHLHLEGFHRRFVIAWRSFLSVDDIKGKTFDADQFIRAHL